MEGIINEIILSKGYLNEETCENEKLGRKLQILKGENIFSYRQIHFISSVIYKGNDGAHLLKGSECEAKSLYNDLSKNFIAFIQLLEDPNTQKTERRIGIVTKITSKNIGYIEEKETKERHLFLLDDLKRVTEVEPQIGEMISYELIDNLNKNKSDHRAIKLRYVGKVGRIVQKNDKVYSFIKSGDREEEIYLNLSYLAEELKVSIKRGSFVEFQLIKGINKNEASEVKLVS